jgi:hypothetical protein
MNGKKHLISEYAKQVLILMYREELESPGCSFNKLTIDNFREQVRVSENDNKDLLSSIMDILDNDRSRLYQVINYLADCAYILIGDMKKTNESITYLDIRLLGYGINFVENVFNNKPENLKQIGVIFNGDVSLNVDALLKNQITDLAGFGKIAESIKEFTKIV